jgi:hypothetical protein
MLFRWVGTALSADWMRPSRNISYTMLRLVYRKGGSVFVAALAELGVLARS